MAATRSSRLEVTDRDALLNFFFSILLVPVIYLMIAWYIASLKRDPARTSEYLYLNSLPLSNSHCRSLFLLSVLYRFAWVPIGLLILMLAIGAIAPVFYLVRLNIFMIILYPFLQIVGTTLHLASSLKTGRLHIRDFPAKNSPLIQSWIVIAFGAVPVVCVLLPTVVSGGVFWAVLGGSTLVGTGVVYAYIVVFDRWRAENTVFRRGEIIGNRMGLTYQTCERILSVPFGSRRPNPLLVNKLVRSSRDQSFVSRFLASLLFIVTAFLLAMNNESIHEAVTVLSWIFSIYAFLVVLRIITRCGADEEIPEMIYELPVTRTQFYISLLLPPLAWLTTVALSLAIMVACAGGWFFVAAGLFLRSLLLSLILCLIGVSFAISRYPDWRSALKRFLGWMLIFALCAGMFYEFRIVVAITAAVLSLLPLMGKRLYRV
jgi:hypothetical protein